MDPVYEITSITNFSGKLVNNNKSYFKIGDIKNADATFGTPVVLGGNVCRVTDLESTMLNGVATALCVDTVSEQKGIYLVAAQVVADDESTIIRAKKKLA